MFHRYGMLVRVLTVLGMLGGIRQAAAQQTWMALSDPGDTQPGAGAPWGLPGQPGFTHLPPNVGDCVWFGKRNLHIATNTKNYTFSFEAGNATKFGVQSLTGYVAGNPPTAHAGGITGVTDVGNERRVTGRITPQPDWEVIKFVRVAGILSGGGDQLGPVKSWSHCSRTTCEGTSLTLDDGLFGALSEDSHRITELQIFAISQPAGSLASQVLDPTPGSGTWWVEHVFVDPEGQPRPQGGVRWYLQSGIGMFPEDQYGLTFAMDGPADCEYDYYAFDANADEFLYFRVGCTLECSPGTPLCFGDSTPGCPCGNDDPGGDGGCANSTGQGSTLTATGSDSVAVDDLVLTATGAIPGQPGLFFQGDVVLGGGNGSPFGNGLRCCGQGVVRLQVVVPNGAGTASTTTRIAASGGAASGESKCYQYWYRDPVGVPCGATFNLTNAVLVAWQP